MRVGSIGISLSGMMAATTRMSAIANNIANAQSTVQSVKGVSVNAPYLPQDTILSADATGGVDAKLVNRDPATIPEEDPDSPVANADGIVNYPNVDDASELENSQFASYDFKANAITLKAAQDQAKTLLDIFA